MAKPDKGLIRKNITIHPSIKDEVVDFAKARSLEVILDNNNAKNIAVITPKAIDFRVYKLHNEATGNNQNFIHVTKLKDLEGIEWNDHVKLSTRFVMPEVDKIVEAVLKNINSKK